MDERLRALAKDVDALCDQFFEAGFMRGALWYNAATLLGTSQHEPALSEEAARTAMYEARSEYWASLQGRFGALLEDV